MLIINLISLLIIKLDQSEEKCIGIMSIIVEKETQILQYNYAIVVFSSRHTASGHHRPASETPFEWRFAREPDGGLLLEFYRGCITLLKINIEVGSTPDCHNKRTHQGNIPM